MFGKNMKILFYPKKANENSFCYKFQIRTFVKSTIWKAFVAFAKTQSVKISIILSTIWGITFYFYCVYYYLIFLKFKMINIAILLQKQAFPVKLCYLVHRLVFSCLLSFIICPIISK